MDIQTKQKKSEDGEREILHVLLSGVIQSTVCLSKHLGPFEKVRYFPYGLSFIFLSHNGMLVTICTIDYDWHMKLYLLKQA